MGKTRSDRWARPVRSAIAAGLACMAFAPVAHASGGDGFTESQYMPENHVASSELKSFASGNVGVLAGSYWHIYQVLAYRALTGHTVGADELDTIGIDGWYVKRYDNSEDDGANNAGANWMAARQQVKGAKVVEDVGSNTVKDDGNYGSFLNCPNDAFATASATLADRIKTGGASWAGVWLAGQDAVFANCGMVGDGPQRKNAPFTPVPALPAGAPAWLVADHSYQLAAALFYGQKYDDAHAAFQAIARDTHSPWQKYGNYMAARSLIRKASLTTFDKDPDANTTARNKVLEAARADLVAALPAYPSAQAMINYVDVRLRPAERTATLSAKLATAKFGPAAEQDLADYLALLDTVGFETDPKDAMTNWINAMQMSTADSVYSDVEGKPDSKQLNTTHGKALALSRKWWTSTHETQWLVAVLANLHKGEATDAELKAASAVPASSSAQPTLQYHLARLALVAGHPAEADTIISTALAKSNLSTSTRNRWLHMQLLSAGTLDGFLAAVPRHTVDDSKPDAIPNEQDAKAAASGEPDTDFNRALYRDMPLDVLVQIYQRAKLGDQRHEDLAEKIWTRAVILGDWATADSLNSQLAKGRDTTAHLYTRFQGAKTDKERKLDATLILVNTPELDPNSIPPGDKPSQWDCQSSVFASDSLHDDPELAQVKPAFLTAAQKIEGSKEGKIIGALPVRTAYLAPALLEWAKTKPDDPEAPKALHFFVASTRPSCQHEGSGGVSKEAFKLLHAQWPKDEWTKKTPYFY